MGLWRDSTPKEQFSIGTDKHQGSRSSLGLMSGLRDHPERVESLISAGITIEGKIEGVGDVRIAGRFNGDVVVEGDLTVEEGAHIHGEIRAKTVILGGEVEGNIHADSRTEVLESGVLIGDLKTGSLMVAPGSRMQGKVDCGSAEPPTSDGNGSDS